MKVPAIAPPVGHLKDRVLGLQYVRAWTVLAPMVAAVCTANQLGASVFIDGVEVLRMDPPETADPSTGVPPHGADCVPTLAAFAAGRRKRSVALHHACPCGATAISCLSRVTGVGLLHLCFVGRVTTPPAEPLEDLIVSVCATIAEILASSVGFRANSMNMAHEVSHILVALGLQLMELDEELGSATRIPSAGDGPSKGERAPLREQESVRRMTAECNLALYVARNFLSQASESRHDESIDRGFRSVDVGAIAHQMVGVYQAVGRTKRVTFDLSGLTDLPPIHGVEEELRRLFHNVLNNAVKYSFHAVPGATQRHIRLWAKMPYDPGFRARRFAVLVENYGIGLNPDELAQVFEPGFRGEQARREVAIGSGIGLAECKKIMLMHHGEIRMRSERLHTDASLTSVELIFPY